MAINFDRVGSFSGIDSESVLNNPTSLQFAPDGRLYVATQSGAIYAFTIAIADGEYIATDREELLLPDGLGVVSSLQNHNDDGTLSDESDRQVTGLVTAGTADNPILYVSSSDPRIAFSADSNLDTNSGVVTQLTWTGTEWSAVDLVRGLPRSEQNHSINGMVLSEDGTKLYLAVGGNTNNGAPSSFFANTGEYALSGTVLAIDLADLDSREVLTDSNGGQNGTPRQYIYNLPTLDDPNIANNNDGIGEDVDGLDETAPWGGNDGLNMAILPADAPITIVADGFRNHYDLVLTDNGLYTVDNGSNSGNGGNPLDIDGNPTEESETEATNAINNGGIGDPEPVFLIEKGEYYGHPVPARANQNLAWTVYDDEGNPDRNLEVNSVSNLADLVPDSVDLADGFLIDPSRFTDSSERLTQSGIRIDRNSIESSSFVNLGSSSNGLTEYTADSFDGALQGGLITTQFNGNVTLINLNDEGTSVEPLIDTTEDDAVIDDDGVLPLITGQSLPLDVTTGADGTLWVAEFGTGKINVFAPSDDPSAANLDIDNDGILNINDPFIRDRTNGNSVRVTPDETLLWDFDANQDGNLPGVNGYGGGLTGVMINGDTDFEAFFQQPSDRAGQIINLDNVKFNTAAGGGNTVIESVASGDSYLNENDGAYLFHTGVAIEPTVETFTVKWTLFNPGSEFTGEFQQIGGYIGTGDQSNYLKLVVVEGLESEIQILLENDDVVVAESLIAAEDIFNQPSDSQIFLELEIDPEAATAIPTVSYETDDGINTITGTAIDLESTAVLEAITGDYTVNEQQTGLAVGLFSSNTGQPDNSTFQAVFDDIEITATGDRSLETAYVNNDKKEPTTPDTTAQTLYRINAGGNKITATDGGIDWEADTVAANSAYLIDAGSNSTAFFTSVVPSSSLSTVPDTIFNSERWDMPDDTSMSWSFDLSPAVYEVRLYIGNGYEGTQNPGERIFDVAVEGNVPVEFANIDPTAQFGDRVGGVISSTVEVTDGTLDLEFLHQVENPMVNGIEILQLTEADPLSVSFTDETYETDESQSQVQISLLADDIVPSDETLYATVEIVPDTAIANLDYQYQSDTATFDATTGIYTDRIAIAGSSFDGTLSIDILADEIPEAAEAFTVNLIELNNSATIGTGSATVIIAGDRNINTLLEDTTITDNNITPTVVDL